MLASPGRRKNHHVSESSGSGNPRLHEVTPESISELEELDLEVYNAKGRLKDDAVRLRQLRLHDFSASTLSDSEEKASASEDENRETQKLVQDGVSATGGQSREKQTRRRRRQIHWTEAEERAVTRKLDRRLVFFLALLYLLSYLDRSSSFYFFMFFIAFFLTHADGYH